ncbi:MAG: L-2-amino-thiazoline-4-carboxylic acid hydrolase [Candidatus Bathyarchaeia archaeon]
MGAAEGRPLQEIIDAMNELMRAWGWVHMYLTRPLEKYGVKGEVIIRKGLREFGIFRGEEMRKWHESEGLPINMESLARYWDAASVFVIMDAMKAEGTFTPYHVKFPVRSCILHDVWKEEGFQAGGYRYCDEIHHEVTKAYHKDGVCEIHENMNKGDEFCGFQFVQVPYESVHNASEVFAERITREPKKYALECLARTVHVVGSLYVHLAKSIVNHLGDEGKKLLRDATLALGEKRGKHVKQRLEAAGKTLTMPNIFAAFDLPYNLMWKMLGNQSNSTYTATVNYCPFAEVWSQRGLSHLGAVFCQNVYIGFFRVFSETADVKIPQCLTSGDSRCTLKFKL